MRATRTAVAVTIAAVSLLAGCASRGSGAFPTRDQLQALAATPPPAGMRGDDRIDLEAWELEGPVAAAVGFVPYEDPGPWGALLAARARARAPLVHLTEDMRCVAREMGRIVLAHGKLPSAPLRHFVEGRCGAVPADVRVHHYSAEVEDGRPEAEVFEAWRASFEQGVEGAVGPGRRVVGVWFGRKDGKAVTVLASGEPQVQVEAAALVPDADGKVRVKGELLAAGESAAAIATQGRFGTARCELDRAVKLPRFQLTCPIAAEDPAAWIELYAFPPGRILGAVALRLLVSPAGAAAATWARPPPAAPVEGWQDAELAQVLVRTLNELRSEAGLAPVRLSPQQSVLASRVAPHYFAALTGATSEAVADTVVLGLRAGWDVEGGIVQNGTFASGWLAGSRDLRRFVQEILDRPSGREALMDPEIRELAVGPLSFPGGVAAVVAGYSFFEEARHAEVARRYLERLTAARAARGATAPVTLAEVDPAAVRAASSVQGGTEPEDALEVLLAESVQALQRPVSGYWMQTSDADQLEFPEPLLAPGPLAVSIAVAHRRPEGEPWGQLVLLIVTATPRGAGSAALSDPNG